MSALVRTLQKIDTAPAFQWLALAVLIFLLPWTASARDQARFTASPEPGRAEAFAVRLKGDLLMSGRFQDLVRVQRLRESLTGDFLWMRHQGEEYVLQDPDLLQRIDELWSREEENLRREESELDQGPGEILKKRRQDLAERREHIDQERWRLFDEKFRLLEAESAPRWREIDLSAELARTEDESIARILRDEIERARSELQELSDRQDDLKRQEADLDRQKTELDQEENAIEREEGGIEALQDQIDARRDDLFRRLDETVLRLLEQAIAEGTKTPG